MIKNTLEQSLVSTALTMKFTTTLIIKGYNKTIFPIIILIH